MKSIYLLLSILLITACTPPAKNNSESKNKATYTHTIPNVSKPDKTLNVGLLIMEGVDNTELTAPMDIFQHTIYHVKPGMKVFTVAKTKAPLTTFEGLVITPDYGYADGDVPQIDVLVVPSAEHHLDTDLEDKAMIDFVRTTGEKAMYVTSHCDGSFVLAKAGLLDGFASTTFPGDIKAYKEMFPTLKVHQDVLFVHDKKFITSAGGAKSFEAALYLVELLYGKKAADGIAKGMVIDWDVNDVPAVIVK